MPRQNIVTRPTPSLFLIFIVTLACMCSPAGAVSVNLPQASESCAVPVYQYGRASAKHLSVEAGCVALALNNVGSLWEVGNRNQSPHSFRGGSAFATMSVSDWTRLRIGDWWISGGTGWTDSYDGNADAAQLWIDLHSGGQRQISYKPTASNVRLEARWYGLGRSLPLRIGGGEGTIELTVRRIVAGEYIDRTVIGSVDEETFAGLAEVISSHTRGGAVVGRGWCCDARTRFRFGNWIGQATAEGLMGRLRWQGLVVDDGYITSPGVFSDAQGFLRDVGGDISGVSSRTNRSAAVNPSWRLDVMRSGRPSVLLSVTARSGEGSIVGAGLAWPQKGAWIPYLRGYTPTKRIEAGVVGDGWRLSVSGDAWLGADPRNATAEVSASLIRF